MGATDAVVGIDLYWLPVGAGASAHVVRPSSRLFEAVAARWQGRTPRDLFHAALRVRVGDNTWVIEMAPAWGPGPREHGTVRSGPVGLRALGRSRLFRYEVRCWRNGLLPDLAAAVDSPVTVPTDADRVRRLLLLTTRFPTATWGRDEMGTGEMWNSNSLVSWLLAASDHDTASLRPPPGGRAPGWDAGLVAAARQEIRSSAGTRSGPATRTG
jgi:hypothetical protein